MVSLLDELEDLDSEPDDFEESLLDVEDDLVEEESLELESLELESLVDDLESVFVDDLEEPLEDEGRASFL